MSGAIGALGASIVRVPQEVLKQRVQADIYPNAAVGFVKMVQENGVGAFYKGYVATVSRDVPWNALSFMYAGTRTLTYFVEPRHSRTSQPLVPIAQHSVHQVFRSIEEDVQIDDGRDALD